MVKKSSEYVNKLFILFSCLASASSVISSSPALSETRESEISEDLIFAAEGQLEPGHLTFRVKSTTSKALEIGGRAYESYEVERYGQNCTSAVVKDVFGSGNFVSWTSQHEKDSGNYGRTTDYYPEPTFYYRIDIKNNILERKLLGRLDMSGDLKTGEVEHVKLVRIDKPWARVWELIKYNVC
jgi:hypothetical protein